MPCETMRQREIRGTTSSREPATVYIDGRSVSLACGPHSVRTNRISDLQSLRPPRHRAAAGRRCRAAWRLRTVLGTGCRVVVVPAGAFTSSRSLSSLLTGFGLTPHRSALTDSRSGIGCLARRSTSRRSIRTRRGPSGTRGARRSPSVRARSTVGTCNRRAADATVSSLGLSGERAVTNRLAGRNTLSYSSSP